MTQGETTYRCGALRDAAGTDLRPGAVTVCGGRVVRAGPLLANAPGDEQRDSSTVVDLPDTLVVPAAVNAHAHLDLTAMGAQEYDGDFLDWVSQVMAWRQQNPDRSTQGVEPGAAMSWRSGVGWVGDIAGSDEAAEAFLTSGMAGVSFIECFGLGRRQAEAIDTMHRRLAALERTTGPGRLGVQPHAPYSAGAALYDAVTEAAERADLPLCTHLAETPEELQFVRDAAGPLADRLRSWGKWDETIESTGLHPVDWLRPRLARRPWLLAHCNYVGDQHIRTLADCRASVAYCPVAGDYFGQPPGGHRYRDMLDAGVNVCLGTDSIVCQPPDGPQPLGVFPQMRHLHRRDGGGAAMADLLLRMATVNGLTALGLDPMLATLRPGAASMLVGVRFDPSDPADPLTQALENDYPVEPIIDPRIQE